MRKGLLLIGLSVLFTKVCSGQDLLIKSSGDSIKAKIIEITDEAVRYKRLNNLEGPTFVANKADLDRIIYANGTEEKVVAPAGSQQKADEVKPKTTEPNIDYKSDGKAGKYEDSQSKNEFEPIRIERNGYYYQDMRMNERRLLYLYKNFNDASLLKEYKAAKKFHMASKVIGLSSIPFAVVGVIFAIMSPIPSEVYDGNGNYSTERPFANLLGPGIALFTGFIGMQTTSIILKSAYKVKIRKSAEHYNRIIAKHDLK